VKLLCIFDDIYWPVAKIEKAIYESFSKNNNQELDLYLTRQIKWPALSQNFIKV